VPSWRRYAAADATRPLTRGVCRRLDGAGLWGRRRLGRERLHCLEAEFIHRADELCRHFRRKRDDLDAKAESTSDTDRQAEVFRRLADGAGATAHKFERLPVPAGDEAIIDRYISTSRDQIDVVRRIADALDEPDLGAVATLLDSGERSGDEVQDIAQDYGFKVCGSEGQ